VERAAIGAFGWIGTTYSVKVAWAPLIDRLALPGLTRIFGRRRAWMLVAQAGIALGLLTMSALDPATQLGTVALVALGIALASATQDVVVDAWRIEAEDPEYQGALAAAYVTGYRVAMLAAGAGALWIAELGSWGTAYQVMAALAGVGLLTTLVAPEPDSAAPAVTVGTAREGMREWVAAAIVGPFRDFVRHHGRSTALVLGLVALYKIPDVVMAGMANPFLLESGYSKGDIANFAKVLGFGATLGGAGIGGLVVAKFGVLRPLIPGLVGLALSNLAFAALAAQGAADLVPLALVITIDNAAGGFASAGFIAWLSSLTDRQHSATQYALLSSLMTLPAKLLSGFSGVAVNAVGWPLFFVGTALLGLPALIAAAVLGRRSGAPPPRAAPPSADAGG